MKNTISALESGAPGTTRTCDLLVRSSTLVGESVTCSQLEPTETIQFNPLNGVLGGVLGGVLIPLTKGRFAVIDREDLARVSAHKWHAKVRSSDGRIYGQSGIGGKTIILHRFIMDAADGMVVDHRDGDGLNNRRHNLRSCTNSQNLKNQKQHKDSLSPFKGIMRHRRKWKAFITADGKRQYLGIFETPIEAAKAYDAAAKISHGEFANLNFPQSEAA